MKRKKVLLRVQQCWDRCFLLLEMQKQAGHLGRGLGQSAKGWMTFVVVVVPRQPGTTPTAIKPVTKLARMTVKEPDVRTLRRSGHIIPKHRISGSAEASHMSTVGWMATPRATGMDTKEVTVAEIVSLHRRSKNDSDKRSA